MDYSLLVNLAYKKGSKNFIRLKISWLEKLVILKFLDKFN